MSGLKFEKMYVYKLFTNPYLNLSEIWAIYYVGLGIIFEFHTI